MLRLLGQDETSAHLAGIYLIGLGWSLVPGWWFIALVIVAVTFVHLYRTFRGKAGAHADY